MSLDTLPKWEANPSTKLKAMVRLIRWHLEMDRRSPMTTVNGQLVDGPLTLLDGPDDQPRDKIVVYTICVANTKFIKQVCGLKPSITLILIFAQVLSVMGINHLSIDNSMTINIRSKVLNEFRASGETGPRVLIVSSVGSNDLNLACANIMIALVSNSNTNLSAVSC